MNNVNIYMRGRAESRLGDGKEVWGMDWWPFSGIDLIAMSNVHRQIETYAVFSILTTTRPRLPIIISELPPTHC